MTPYEIQEAYKRKTFTQQEALFALSKCTEASGYEEALDVVLDFPSEPESQSASERTAAKNWELNYRNR